MWMFGISLLLLSVPRVSLGGWPFGGEQKGGGPPSDEDGPMIQMEGMPMFEIETGGGQPMGGMPMMEIEMGQMPQGMMPVMGMPQGGMMIPVVMDGHFGFDPFEDLHRGMVKKLTQPRAGDGPPPRGGGPEILSMDGPQIIIGGPTMGGGRGPRNPLEALFGPMMGGSQMGGGQMVKAGGNQHGPSLELDLGGLLSMIAGDHDGQVGRAEGSFEVDDDHKTRILISAKLPGYKLNSEDLAKSPLSVKVLGHRSVVVSGSQQMGPMVRTWQRSFAMPRGVDTDKISVTYLEKCGNLTVEVPRDNSTGKDDEEEEEEQMDGDMEGMPPVLRAMMEGVPGILNELNGGHGRRKPQDNGFLLPQADAGPDFASILNSLGAMHPRNHLPHSKPVPEEAQVNFIGCFAESQMAKAQLKYYGGGNAASFAAMYWHSRADHVPYFAMSRHGEPMGHAFTLRDFAHEHEKPKWGVYDGCGQHCADPGSDSRYCGCTNEAERGFPSRHCPDDGERRFAVYKMAQSPSDAAADEAKGSSGHTKLSAEESKSPVESLAKKLSAEAGVDAVSSGTKAGEGSTEANSAAAAASPEAKSPAAAATGSHGGRPYWQMAPEGKAGEQAIEVMVPRGTIPEAKGREILFFNATGTEDAEPLHEAANDRATKNRADESTPEESAPSGLAKPVGKVRLPKGVKPEGCTWEAGRIDEDGNQVLKCVLQKDEVKTVKIKVVEEL